MIEMNDQEIELISGGVAIEGYPSRDPIENDTLNGSNYDPTVKMNM